MKTLALSGGDLVVGSTGHGTISGASKVRQDLTLALGEYWGTDRFHADQWGSVIIDFIGLPLTPDVEAEVRAEVSRVLSNYVAIQDQQIYADLVSGERSRFTTTEVVRQVSSVTSRIALDSVFVQVVLLTEAGEAITINRTVAL